MASPKTPEETGSSLVSPRPTAKRENSTKSSLRRRGPPPSLSLGSLSPLLPPFSPPPSFAGTPVYQYLSPPISIASIASPPPRPAADDYLSGGKGRHNTRRDHRSHSSMIGSEGSQGPVAPSNIPSPLASLVDATKADFAGLASSNDDGTTVAPLSAPLITTQPKDRRRSWQLRDSIEVLPSDVKATFLPPPLDVPEGSISPAVNALRRLSRTPTQPRDTGRADLRRFSRALTGPLGRVFTLKDAPPGVGMIDEETAFLTATGAYSADLDYGTGHHDHVTLKEDDLSEVRATPAIITLRKASAAYRPYPTTTLNPAPITTSLSPKSSHAFESPSDPNTSTASLLAFDSKHTVQESQPISSNVPSFKENDQASSPRDMLIRRTSLVNDYSPPHKTTRSMTLLGNTAVNRRQSVTAEAALTRAEFFPCPGNLISPCSKPNLLSPEKSSARTSVVHFATGSSVHKIIWRANESSTSGSPSSPVSPTNSETPSSKDRSPSRKPSDYVDQQLFVIPSAEHDTAHDDTPSSSPRKSWDQRSPAQREAQAAFFAWSWESSPPPVMESYVSSQGAHLTKATTFDGVTVKNPALSDRHDPLARGEESQSRDVGDQDLGGLGSEFMPKKQRSRTSPTVQLSDVKAETGSNTEKGGRISSLRGNLLTPARVGNKGSVGRSVGVSSHARRPSRK
ncbi:hypothetical protein MMC07_003441 [Pseudocyphellaria aurata]|nr:hypothetical protein [Pseudocyphellaria aurata]